MVLKVEDPTSVVEGLCRVSLGDDLTIYAIETLKKELSTLIESNTQLELNLKNVEEIDSAGIQLLLGLQREAQRLNISIKLTALSAPVTKLVKMYCIADSLDIGEAL